MKKAILILTVVLFTLTAQAGSFYHTCSSSGYYGYDYYTEDIYIDRQASVYVSVYGGNPGGGNPSADLNIVNNDTYEAYGNTSWGITQIPTSISPGNWTVNMNADGDGGSCTLSISW